MKCPYCDSEHTEPFLKISKTVTEWICRMCGLTWNVESE